MDKPPPHFALFNEIGIIAQLSRTVMEEELPDGLTAPHFGVLNHLTRVRDGQTPLALATAFQVPKTTMTHTLGGLEARGLVELRPNPKDGRSKQVWLTDKGRAQRLEAVARVSARMGPFAEAFPAEDVARLLPDLVKIREFLDKARDP